MQYLGLIFGIFGFLAYMELSGLKRRISDLEEQMAKTKGTPAYVDRQSLIKLANDCIGKKIHLDLREDYEDIDIMMYGNSSHGFNTILDLDDEWLLIRIESPKVVKEKLIRMDAIQMIHIL